MVPNRFTSERTMNDDSKTKTAAERDDSHTTPIHMSLRGGGVWNVWGGDCVVLRLRKGILRVGTDDAEQLADFLKARLSHSPSEENTT
jgi:hypothetical protein